jgi:hypothetical protein
MAEQKTTITQFIIEIYTDGALNKELTSCFQSLRIINSTRAIWPIYELYCNIDNQVIIEQNLYGTQDFQIKIWYTGENGEKIDEPVTYDLLYMQAAMELPAKPEHSVPYTDMQDTQRRLVVFSFLSKPAYLTMTQFMNKLWEEETEKTPIEIVKEILDLRGIEYIIYEDNKNEDKIQQLILPPMTIKNCIDYIDERFAIFKGPLFRYANYAGQFLMWDLRAHYDKFKDSGFTKHHKLPNYAETQGLWDSVNQIAIETPDNFVTYDRHQTLHYANAVVAKYGYDNIYITHPHEDIAYFLKFDVPKMITDVGIWHNSEEMKYFEESLKHRKLYYYDMKGFETGSGYTGEYNDFILQTDMADNIQDAVGYKFYLYRNVKFHYCQKVGEVFYMKPYADHEKFSGSSYEGAYLVSDSEIVFTKLLKGAEVDNLNCIVTLTGHRTVQQKE